MMLYLMLTCDWEGRENIHKYYYDMKGLRDDIRKSWKRDLPITHFITPRSYDNTLVKWIRKKKGVLPIDEIGLHIHCWTDLLQKMSPSVMAEANNLFLTYKDTNGNSGKDLPLVKFTKESIKEIVRYCHDKLQKISGQQVVSFRGGAWFASDDVYEILPSFGILNDSSPIPYELINYPRKSIKNAIKDLWGPWMSSRGNSLSGSCVNGQITTETQPYHITTAGSKKIGVFPMTWGMDVNAEAWKIRGWLRHERRLVESGCTRYVNLGFHDTLIQRNWVLPVLRRIKKELETTVPFEFVTVSEAATKCGW